MTAVQFSALRHARELAQAGVGTIVNHTPLWIGAPMLKIMMEQLTEDLLKIINDIEEVTE